MKKAFIGIILFIGLFLFLGGCSEVPTKCETDEDCFMLDCFQAQTHGICKDGKCVCPEPQKADFKVHEWGVIAGCPESKQYLLTSRPEQVMLVKQPVVYVHAGDLNEFDLRVGFSKGKPTLTYPEATTVNKTVEWNNVKVIEECLEEKMRAVKGFEPVPLEQIIPTLNNVNADCLKFNETNSRFLFYEGKMPFENKVEAEYNKTEKKAVLKNNSNYTVYDLTVSVSVGESFIDRKPIIGYAEELRAGEEKTIELKERSTPDLKKQMVEVGFTEKEAIAFQQLWQQTFFYPSNAKEFTRLSYRLPQNKVEKMVSLEFNPQPKKELRTLWVLVDLPAKKTTDLKEKCCEECIQAAKYSVAQMDTYAVECGTYPSTKELSKECKEYFKENKLTANECGGGKEEVLTPKEVLERKDELLNKKITVKGVAKEGLIGCTEMECPPEQPCCNSCSGSLELEKAGSKIKLTGPYNGKSVSCSGNECSIKCWPLTKGKEYRATGTWKRKEENYYLEISSFTRLLKPSVSIKTSKQEYQKGETIELSIEFGDEFGGKVFGYAPVYTILKKFKDNWQPIGDSCFCTIPCSEDKNCERYGIMCNIMRPKCKEMKKGTLYKWSQNQCLSKTIQCINMDGNAGTEPCSIDLNAGSGTYKFKLSYYLDENCMGKAIKIESNEFQIMAPEKIIEVCEEEREKANEIKNSEECQGEEFRCVDGWSNTHYFDKRLILREIPPQQADRMNLPEKLENAVVARHSYSTCSCTKPIEYRIRIDSGFTESSCESFYSFVEDYNAACNGCIREWVTGCC